MLQRAGLELRQRLRNPLFKLEVHTDRKIMPAYALVLGKTGPKLQPSEAALLTDQRCGPGEGAAGQKNVDCRHITMAVLADVLQGDRAAGYRHARGGSDGSHGRLQLQAGL